MLRVGFGCDTRYSTSCYNKCFDYCLLAKRNFSFFSFLFFFCLSKTVLDCFFFSVENLPANSNCHSRHCNSTILHFLVPSQL